MLLQSSLGIWALRLPNSLIWQKGFPLRLTKDPHCGLTWLGEAGGVCDCLYYCSVSEGSCTEELGVQFVYVCTYRDEWRDRCGRCQSDSQASVSPGGPEEPLGWTLWTACYGDRRMTIKAKRSEWSGILGRLTASHHERSSKTQLKSPAHPHRSFQIFWLGWRIWQICSMGQCRFVNWPRGEPRVNSENSWVWEILLFLGLFYRIAVSVANQSNRCDCFTAVCDA